MKKEEILSRVEDSKERLDNRELMNKPNKRKASEDRRKVDRRRSIEELEIEKRDRKADIYE